MKADCNIGRIHSVYKPLINNDCLMLTSCRYYTGFSDDQLFAFVKQDDGKAFEEIYNRYWPFLLDNAYKPLQSRDKAEDVVQEIFISLYQRRKSIDLSVSLRAYLCKALKFKVSNEFRSQIVRDTYRKSLFFTNNYKNDLANKLEAKELEQAIDRSVSLLPDKCKKAFLLSRHENLSYKDISGELDISVSTVEKHISKALKVIKLNLNL